MPAPRKPDPARSYALIIGTSEYDDAKYPQVRAVKDTAEAFKSLIATERMWNLPPRQNIKALTGRVTVRQAAAAIEEAAARPVVDGLFVYLCTHGRRWTDNPPDQGLHFALSDSAWNWPFTHLPFQWVRRTLARARAATTLLIIDSCWADDSFLGDPGPLQSLALPGACTMIATKSRVPADTSWQGSDYTAFSGALIDTIGTGVEGAGEYLTPETIFPAVLRKLRADNHPEPDYRVRGSVIVCVNKAYRQVTSETPFDELMAGLDEVAAVQPAVYAAAIADADREDGQSAVRQLISEFGAKRPAAETVKLAELLRSRGAPSLDEHADRLIGGYYASRDGSDITGLLHLLHRQGEDDIDTDTDDVLGKLTDRPAQITADLSASLRGTDCPGCRAIGRRIDDQVLDLWQGPRRIELLAALH